MSIYVQSNQIISELRCHRNLSTSSKTVPLCLKQVLVVRTSLIQTSDTRTSFLTILRFLYVIFFIICHDFNPSVWHTQRITNFVTIFLWRFFAPVWHSLYIKFLICKGHATWQRFLQRIRQNPPNPRKIISRDGVFNEIVIARHAQLHVNRFSR